jgi:phosphoadenosine phosphosulfate reductase
MAITTAEIEQLAGEADGLEPEQILDLAARAFGAATVFTTSLGAEDQVITHMIRTAGLPFGIVTIDTGRLPEETYQVLERTNRRYGITVPILFPERAGVEQLVAEQGPLGFYNSVQWRRACCHVRKVEPLARALHGQQCWVTGLRAEQSPARGTVKPFELDAERGVVKCQPLAAWSNAQVWAYIREYAVPYNVLHDRGYPSIGCAACTRAVAPGDDPRSGRWWWEQGSARECGLHRHGTGDATT